MRYLPSLDQGLGSYLHPPSGGTSSAQAVLGYWCQLGCCVRSACPQLRLTRGGPLDVASEICYKGEGSWPTFGKWIRIYKVGVNMVDSIVNWRQGGGGQAWMEDWKRGREALAITSVGKHSQAFLFTSQWNRHWEWRLISCLALL